MVFTVDSILNTVLVSMPKGICPVFVVPNLLQWFFCTITGLLVMPKNHESCGIQDRKACDIPVVPYEGIFGAYPQYMCVIHCDIHVANPLDISSSYRLELKIHPK